MRQFLYGSDTAFANLEQRARRACIVFQDQEMPPGTQPSHARVGFEVNPDDGSALLLVDRGLLYTGPFTEVREWLDAGYKWFPSFAELRRWLQGSLAVAYGLTAEPPASGARPALTEASHPGSPPAPPDPAQLTDLNAVRRQAPEPDAPLYLDEEALFRQLAAYVRGQEPALRLLARRVCRHLARRVPRRPLTLFAVGPTGVGKTRTAEVLSLALRAVAPAGAGYAYLRLDMAEYQERHRVSQLLGAPQGYVGYGEGAQLVDALAANPRTVVLFDEIEKAHRDVLQALMNAMDAGRLSTAAATARGRELDCRQAIFFFTTNLDSAGILRELETREAFDQPGVVDQVCRSHLRAAGVAPELVGRITAFLVFRPLSAETRAEIVALAIARVAEEYGVQVEYIEPAVIARILARAQSDGFGARPYEYLVDEVLGETLAHAAASGATASIRLGVPPFQCAA